MPRENLMNNPILERWVWKERIGNRPTDIIDNVCSFFDLPRKVVFFKTKRRKTEVVIVRRVCMYMLRKKTFLSMNDIGELFDTDHGGVSKAIQCLLDEMHTDPDLKHYVQKLENNK